MSSDLTFITNEPGKSLFERFKVLLGSNTRFLDCLVGYFYVSGFFKLYPTLEKTEKLRILIGMKTDRTTYDLLQKAKDQQELFSKSHAVIKEQIPGEILSELETSEDTSAIEIGVTKFVEWVKSGKLEIKVYPSEKIHAKLYIMTFAEGDRDKGRVITGSSNLTQAGLQDNLEFNVELKNRSDYDFAIQQFNKLWADGVEVSKAYVETIETKSPYALFTPYELYLKFLYEYFKDELNRPTEIEDMYLPVGFKKLKYQEEAVLNAKKVLEEYGGVFLSDVVGLGKTYMSALLAKELDGRSLVIAPPALLDKNNPGSWPNVFGDFRVPHTDFESIGKIEDLLDRDISKYANVFIDESHRFRTETNVTYEKLAQICRGKRVILVSATPLNNTPCDILSQIKLFQNGKNSTIPNLRNLEAFFNSLEKKLRGLDRLRDRDRYFKIVQTNAKEVREKVLKYLMIRRTRTEIDRYYGADLTSQGMRFPDVRDPEPIFYAFSPRENEIFITTMTRLVKDFTYARYKPLYYYEGDHEDKDQVQGQINLARFMMILTVKRLESSFHAFRLTLGRFIETYEQVLAEYERGHVYISKKHTHKIFDYLASGDDEAIEKLIEEEKAEKLNAKEFRTAFIRDLKHDLKILHEVRELWKDVKRDPKWEAFREILINEKQLKTGKPIIFTESRETAEYLAAKIKAEVEPRVIQFSGQSDAATREKIIANFDAKAYRPQDDLRILVTTDVLAEGVNLHRSNTVINYDIPWNPTRLMQRVGRVNRIDTKFEDIHTYNYFPTEESEDLIKLRAAAEAKIRSFIEMLGADARLLTDNESIKSHELFARLNSKKTITGEDEDEESELEYLTEIRNIRDNQSALFKHIVRLPKKARSSRTFIQTPFMPVTAPPALLTYFRQGKLDKFFISDGAAKSAFEVDFLNAVKILRANKDDPRQSIHPDFYELLVINKAAFQSATAIDAEEIESSYRGGSNEAYILKRLKAADIRNCEAFTDDDEEFVRQIIRLIEDGALPRPTTKKVATTLKKEIKPLKVLGILRRDIPHEFFRARRAGFSRHADSPREVILSSFLASSSRGKAGN